MKLLLVSYSYPPEISPGSHRIRSLVESIQKDYTSIDIYLFTSLYGKSNEHFVLSSPKLCNSKSILYKVLNYFVFVAKLGWTVKQTKPDKVFCTSSRFLSAFFTAFYCRFLKIPYYLDIRDNSFLYLESTYQFFNTFLLKKLFGFMQAFTFSKCKHLFITSKGFLKSFTKFIPAIKRNEVTEIVHGSNRFKPDVKPIKNTILYAGSIGKGQQLHLFLPDLARLLPDYNFKVVGDGNSLQLLQDRIDLLGLTNVEQLPRMKQHDLNIHLKSVAFTLIHTADSPVFEELLPTKIAHYAEFPQPIIACTKGYAKEFLKANVAGAYIFNPFDYKSVAKWIKSYTYKLYDRTTYCKQFSLESGNKQIADILLK